MEHRHLHMYYFRKQCDIFENLTWLNVYIEVYLWKKEDMLSTCKYILKIIMHQSCTQKKNIIIIIIIIIIILVTAVGIGTRTESSSLKEFGIRSCASSANQVHEETLWSSSQLDFVVEFEWHKQSIIMHSQNIMTITVTLWKHTKT